MPRKRSRMKTNNLVKSPNHRTSPYKPAVENKSDALTPKDLPSKHPSSEWNHLEKITSSHGTDSDEPEVHPKGADAESEPISADVDAACGRASLPTDEGCVEIMANRKSSLSCLPHYHPSC